MIGVASSSPGTEDCGNEAVDECYRNVQTFLLLTDLPFSSSRAELDGFCHRTLAGYNCSTALFNSKCISEKDRFLLPMFTSMAEYMFLMLCGKEKIGQGYLREAFLSHSQCVLDHKKEMECCAKETGITDLPVLKIMEDSGKSLTAKELLTCCPVSRYLQCTEGVARRNCGDSAANFTGEYIRRAAGENVQFVCQKMPGYPAPDTSTCSMAVPECKGAAAGLRWSLLLIAAAAAVALVGKSLFWR